MFDRFRNVKIAALYAAVEKPKHAAALIDFHFCRSVDIGFRRFADFFFCSFDRFFEFVVDDRFNQVFADVEEDRLSRIIEFAVARQDDRVKTFSGFFCFFNHFEAAHARHTDIGDDDVGVRLFDLL